MSVRVGRLLCTLVLALSAEMSVGDFVAVQRLTDHQRRERFGLPKTCAPMIIGLRGTRGMVHVLVTCADVTRHRESATPRDSGLRGGR